MYIIGDFCRYLDLIFFVLFSALLLKVCIFELASLLCKALQIQEEFCFGGFKKVPLSFFSFSQVMQVFLAKSNCVFCRGCAAAGFVKSCNRCICLSLQSQTRAEGSLGRRGFGR